MTKSQRRNWTTEKRSEVERRNMNKEGKNWIRRKNEKVGSKDRRKKETKEYN